MPLHHDSIPSNRLRRHIKGPGRYFIFRCSTTGLRIYRLSKSVKALPASPGPGGCLHVFGKSPLAYARGSVTLCKYVSPDRAATVRESVFTVDPSKSRKPLSTLATACPPGTTARSGSSISMCGWRTWSRPWTVIPPFWSKMGASFCCWRMSILRNGF
jgi:hypothetical protein